MKFTSIYTETVLKFRNVQDLQNFYQTVSWNVGEWKNPLLCSEMFRKYRIFIRLCPEMWVNKKACYYYVYVNISDLKGVVGQIVHHDKVVLAVKQNEALIPPNYTRYLAWGFSDLSVRIGNYDSDKVGKWRQVSCSYTSSKFDYHQVSNIRRTYVGN